MSVTDLSNGVWCEVQVEYRHLHPHLKSSKEWAKMAEKGSPVVLKTDRMRMGSVIHMKKGMAHYSCCCSTDTYFTCFLSHRTTSA